MIEEPKTTRRGLDSSEIYIYEKIKRRMIDDSLIKLDFENCGEQDLLHLC